MDKHRCVPTCETAKKMCQICPVARHSPKTHEKVSGRDVAQGGAGGGAPPPRQILSANFAGKFWKNWSVSDIIRLNILECNKINSKHILYTLPLSAHPSYIVTSMYFRHGFYFYVGILQKFVGKFEILSAQPPPPPLESGLGTSLTPLDILIS